MTRNSDNPEHRLNQVNVESAWLLSEAVIHFVDKALESRLEPTRKASIDVIKQAERAVENQLTAIESLNSALVPIQGVSRSLQEFRDEAGRYLQEIDGRHQDIVTQSVNGSMVKFNHQLELIINKVDLAYKAMSSSELALRSAGELYLREAGERLSIIEVGHRELLQTSIGAATELLTHALHPLYEQSAGVLNNTQASSDRLNAASTSFEVALTELRQGPPALATFLEKAQSQLDRVQLPQAAVLSRLDEVAQRLDRFESITATALQRIQLGFAAFGLALAGMMAWLFINFRR